MQHDDLLWRHTKSVPAFRALLRAVESRFYQDIELARPVLDLGCGDGQFAQATFPGDATPEIGVDPWWGPLSESRDRGIYQLSIQATGNRLPFPDNYFGSVISNSVLEHIQDLDPVVGEIARVLKKPDLETGKPGGSLIITMPSDHFVEFLSISRLFRRLSLGGLAERYERAFDRISRHHHCDSPAVWHQRLSNAGLRTVKWTYYFSQKAHWRLEWGHVFGLPSLISKWIFGRWIIAPWRSSLEWTDRWLRPAYEEPLPTEGAYLLFIAERDKVSDALPDLPEPEIADALPTVVLAPMDEISEPLVRSTSDRDGESAVVDSKQKNDKQIAPLYELKDTPVKNIRPAIWLALAFLAATIGQISWNWQERPYQPVNGLVWYTIATILFGIFGWHSRLSHHEKPRKSGEEKVSDSRSILIPRILTFGLAVVLVSWAWAQGKDLPRVMGGAEPIILVWLAGIGLSIIAVWPNLIERLAMRFGLIAPISTIATTAPGTREHIHPRMPLWEIVVIIGFFLVSWIIRFYQLDDIPYVLSGDEANMGLEAVRVLQGQLSNPFITGWLSHPTLYFFILAYPIQFLGRATLALRFLSPIAGALTVVALYLFARKAWGRSVAISASLLLTGYHFHIHFSRLALNNIWDPLFALAVLGMLWVGWRDADRRYYIGVGLCLGFSQYFYMGARMLLVLISALLFYWLVTDRRRLWAHRGHILVLLLVALMVSLPITLYSIGHPDDYMARLNQLGIFPSGWLEREVELTNQSQRELLWQQVWKSALAFNYTVDPTYWYRPNIPLLRFFPSIFFIFGGLISLASIKKTPDFMVLAWWWATVLFAGALLENPPSSQRFVIVAPAVCIFIARSLDWIFKRLERLGGGNTKLWIAALFTISTIFAWGDMAFYFNVYAENGDFGGVNTEVAQRIADYIGDLGSDNNNIYFFGFPRMLIADRGGFPTVPFMVPDVARQDVMDPILLPSDLPVVRFPAIFLFLPERARELEIVKAALPGGVEKHFPGRYGRMLFIAYEAP